MVEVMKIGEVTDKDGEWLRADVDLEELESRGYESWVAMVFRTHNGFCFFPAILWYDEEHDVAEDLIDFDESCLMVNNHPFVRHTFLMQVFPEDAEEIHRIATMILEYDAERVIH